MNKDLELSEHYTTWGYSKLLQHTDVLHRIQKERYFQPIQIQLCPTENCQSDCSFCAVGYRPYKSIMSWTKLEKCVRDFKSLGAKSLEISGGGNPLLYRDYQAKKDINDIIELGSSLGLDIGIITNSEKLSRISPRLYDKINWIRISLIRLDEGKNPTDYDLAGFPQEKLGFSYIIYDAAKGCRTGREYDGTIGESIDKILELVELYPNVKFVRIAGNSLITGYNELVRQKYQSLFEKYPKVFIKDIGEDDYPYDGGCYVGMIRPFIAASPDGDGKYYVYICNSHVLFSGQTYNKDYGLCEVGDVLSTWEKLNQYYKEHGYPYEVSGNKGCEWKKTCKLCFYQPNNRLLDAVVKEIPDKNFP